jgi:hypothetical protein
MLALPTSPESAARSAAVEIQIGDQAAARRVVDRLKVLGRGQIIARIEGELLYVAGAESAISTIKQGGHLGDQPNFRRAVGDLGDAQSLFYLDLSPLATFASALGDAGPRVGRLAAVGVVGRRDGDVATSRVRIVVK